MVDALRTSVTGSVDEDDYTFDRRLSQSSSVYSINKESVFGEKCDLFAGTKSVNGSSGAHVGGLNLRHIPGRKSVIKPRPPTDVSKVQLANVILKLMCLGLLHLVS